MSAYVALATLKESVGLDDTADDSPLNLCIWRASAAVDGWLEQNRVGYVGFAASSNSRTAVGSNTRVYDGTGDDWLWIDDATSIATVSVDAVSVSSNSWRLWPYNDVVKRAIVYAEPATSLRGLRADYWARGTANVGVTGYFGLDHVPYDVENTTLAIAIVYWRRLQQGQPEPVVTPRGSQGFVMADPEIEALLETGLAGWRAIGVWGG